jgi:hypothetical protein
MPVQTVSVSVPGPVFESGLHFGYQPLCVGQDRLGRISQHSPLAGQLTLTPSGPGIHPAANRIHQHADQPRIPPSVHLARTLIGSYHS